MSKHKIVGIMDEDPYDPFTWSGSSAFFFNALKQCGALNIAISAKPPVHTQLFYKIFSFQPNKRKWKFKYHLNLGLYKQMTHIAKKRLEKIDKTEYDIILQVGAWYDMTGDHDKKVISYHDGNLAAYLNSPHGYPQISPSYIKRTMMYEYELYNKIHLIFPMSKWLADSFIRDFKVRSTKIFPVGAGINLPQVNDVTNKTYEAPRILFVGKDFIRKGGKYLLQAFKLLQKEIKDAELTIIGPRLKNPPKGVRCIGPISKMDREGVKKITKEYERATVFALPSLYEPFGIALIEAMAHRLPCIGTNSCAMPEIVQHGTTGFVVQPRDPVSLAENLLFLLKNPTLCRIFGEAGYNRYLKHYSWNAVTKYMTEVINNEF